MIDLLDDDTGGESLESESGDVVNEAGAIIDRSGRFLIFNQCRYFKTESYFSSKQASQS